MRYFVFVLAVAFSINSHAWKETGGGDDAGLEFQRCFNTAVENLLKAGAISAFDDEQFTNDTDSTKIIVVNHALQVPVGESAQYSVAINEPLRRLVTIDRARWNAIKDVHVKEAIALHEILSILGVERTGIYTYSEQYLTLAQSLGAAAAAGSPAGFTVPIKEHPEAKTLSCRIDYSPIDTPSGGAQMDSITVKLEPSKVRPDQLEAKKEYVTKDGRWHLYFWGVQPFVTSYRPKAFEYTGMEIDNTVTHTSSTTGVFADNQNMDHSSLSLLENFDPFSATPPDHIGGISADCVLK